MDGGQAKSRNAQLSAHLVMSVVMVMIYSSAKRSIKVDTTPLFGSSNTTFSPPKQPKITRKTREEPKTFSDLLNEALDSPTLAPQTDRFPHTVPKSLSPQPFLASNPTRIPESPRAQFSGLNITPQKTQQVGYSDEMDWTPTDSQSQARSQYRAFQDSPLSNGPRRPFNQAPVSTEQSPFWYKVPAAPTNPSQRLRNPNAPILRSKPVEKESIFFRGAAKKKGEDESDEREVAFKPPSFFAPQESNDEANGLADLLSQSFTLGQEHDSPVKPSGGRSSGWASRNRAPPGSPQLTNLGVEVMTLAVLLVSWGFTAAFPMPFGREIQLALLSAAGTIALRVTGEKSRDKKHEQVPTAAIYISSALSVLELAAVCGLGWEVWRGNANASKYGIGLLTVMIGHQVWSSTV
ncbi:hypothetical protein ACHAPU_002596 [Fusarium lateritium]